MSKGPTPRHSKSPKPVTIDLDATDVTPKSEEPKAKSSATGPSVARTPDPAQTEKGQRRRPALQLARPRHRIRRTPKPKTASPNRLAPVQPVLRAPKLLHQPKAAVVSAWSSRVCWVP